MAFCNRVMMVGSFSSKSDASNYSPLHPTSVGPAGGNYTPTLSRHSNSSSLRVTTTTKCDLKSNFLKVYDCLKSELLHDTSFEFDDDSRKWVDRMIDYNIPGGKCTRGLSVVDSYQLLKGEQLSDDELFLACALGWCTEWLQAYMLVTDDIIDNSDFRRGQPCWFRQTEVGMIAVNDALIIRSHIFIILRKHFNAKPYYVELLELFNEVEYQTISGQMIDMISPIVGNTTLSKCSLSTNRRINQYKTSYYSFYLPVACALLLIGENLQSHVQVKDILVEMGIYFTVQDDYLDTYGDPKVFGKIGTDIENGKCSWLIAKALKLSNEEQKKILNESYGRKDPLKVAQVKELYHTLNLQGVYEDYENKTHEELMRSIDTLPSREVQLLLKSFLEKIYKRQK